MNGEGPPQELRSAQFVPSTLAVPGADLLNRLTPDLRQDPRTALRDMRLREPHRTILADRARQEGLEFADESRADDYDPRQSRVFTVLRGRNVELILVQIDDWVVNDGGNIGALTEVGYAFRGKRVCILSIGVDAPAKGLDTLRRRWKNDLQIEGEFVPWRYVAELEGGLHSLGSVFDIELARPAGVPGPGPQPQPSTKNESQVFISYSHADGAWLKRLRVMLKPAERQFPTAVWSDTQIAAGARWATEIDEALASAKVVLLLVSPNFLDSDFIHEQELGPVLAAANKGQKKILWLLLSECLWKQTAIKDYQAAHDIKKPLDQLSRPQQNAQLRVVAETVLKTLEQLP
jgi:hypothetical protein